MKESGEHTANGILTAGRDGGGDIGRILSEDNSETSLQVEVDVAVEEPRAGVVRREADGDVVTSGTGADDVALGRVDVVVVGLASAADDVEGVLERKESVR